MAKPFRGIPSAGKEKKPKEVVLCYNQNMKKNDLSGLWKLSPADASAIREFTPYFTTNDSVSCTIPGDIHTALLDEAIIPDPFIGEQELEIQWVGQNDWVLMRDFEFNEKGRSYLNMTMVDTLVDVYINSQCCGHCFNQFRPWSFEVTDLLHQGKNEIRLVFHSTEKEASRIAAKLDYNIPYSVYPVYSPHRNLIRKTQCQAGWDWGPCIQCSGIYENISIDTYESGRLTSYSMFPDFVEGKWQLEAKIWYEAFEDGSVDLKLECNNSSSSITLPVIKGNNCLKTNLICENVELWWPNGYGYPKLYKATLVVDDILIEKNIGFRTLKIKCDLTEDGKRPLTICVNSVDIFAKGTNWIPFDSFPSRWTNERYYKLIRECQAANMNAIRLWGGGLYEKEDFYEVCDSFGILIWHDCMFSCSMYPATDDFLSNVAEEIEYQARRIQCHPSLALWCGNNEDIGAIGWYEESRNNPERYIQDFEKLNYDTVGRIIKKEDPHHLWWPSSPCAGPNDYSDNWHSDGKGDMHIWSVWHDGEPFEFYRTFRPRFASEFGFQSFPSLSTIEGYAPGPHERLDSPELSHHQKNPAGNSIITGNFKRYFREPKAFDQMVYLSQVQQALAMSTAISYWRSLIPYCMGTLYWQLDETWPGCSWSSIEYNGKWKLLHYAAKHFYQSVACFAYLDSNRLMLKAVNDLPKAFKASATSTFYDYSGKKLESRKLTFKLNPKSCEDLISLLPDMSNFNPSRTFCVLDLKTDEFNSRSFSYLTLPKDAELQYPEIKYTITKEDDYLFKIELSSKHPGFHVSLDTSIPGLFNDNSILLLPKKETTVWFIAAEECSFSKFESSLRVYDLRNTY